MKTIEQKLNNNSYSKGFVQTVPGPREQKTFPTIVIVPGGGYKKIPIQQTEAIANAFYNQGFNAIYLRYSITGEVSSIYPNALVELAQTIKSLKNNSDWPIDDRIFIAGFSAGGQIVSLFNDYWKTQWLNDAAQTTATDIEPTAIILGYPVISPLLGYPNDDAVVKSWIGNENVEKYAADLNVNQDNKPTFLWVTREDQVVPIINSISYISELNKNNIPLEFHIFNHGPHALALANTMTATKDQEKPYLPHVAHWFNLMMEWIKDFI